MEKRTAELRQSRDELEVRVADRTQDLVKSNLLMEAEVVVRTKAEQKAAAASQAKTQFLTNMSHEIRTPINGIMGMTDLALATDISEEQREYLEIVKASADSLLLIVNDIMDFSQMESDKLTLEEMPFRISGIIGRVGKDFGAARAPEKFVVEFARHSGHAGRFYRRPHSPSPGSIKSVGQRNQVHQ